jgi:CHASE2 domain-containing sensor protein
VFRDQVTAFGRNCLAGLRAFRKRWLFGLLVVWFVAAQATGVFDFLDNRLSELRFASHSRSPSGSIVLVDIDARSLAEIGVWPWPRHLYGDLLASAATAGAARLAFDIDFSSSSSATEDQSFADDLATAGIETYLAAFAQPETAGTATLHATMPIEPLLQASWPVSVDVAIDGDGQLRRVPFATDLGGETLSSLSSVLAGRENHSGTFGIDYSISASQIPRVSFVDLLNRRVAPEALAGKMLIVGASAVELRDLFTVPVYGTVSGSLVHALAAETLIQQREISRRPLPTAALNARRHPCSPRKRTSSREANGLRRSRGHGVAGMRRFASSAIRQRLAPNGKPSRSWPQPGDLDAPG